MSIGALTRSAVIDNLATLVARATDLAQSDQAEVTSAAQGRAHKQFSVRGYSDRDVSRVRAVVVKEFTAVIEYAYRLKPRQQFASQKDAIVLADRIERTLVDRTQTELQNMTLTRATVAATLSGSKEWWTVRLTAVGRYRNDMDATP